ncbi:hypothetical protein A9CBEGH2_08000 [Amedibacterium intestinale]|uniref:phage minor head protein n=1 Tax=Amedibacterium intestinale TaxID=2583452 RepID=UPI001373D830|nr:phage minor head protein [Amedibacterium intestinale]BBK61860.1 hypothetical protein A9CBEGH2_08000 [Amedibacterium intestinale]
MNKRQKEVIQSQLKDEEAIIKKLKATYNKAIRDINQKIKILQADELTQSKIYQIEYQKALKMQIKAILDNLNANQYTDIQEYLKKCYEEGFLGTMYDLQGQGIPLVFPIDQNQVVKALTNDTKLSKSLYESLGFHVKTLQKQINAEISRGIANGYSYSDITRNVLKKADMGVRRALRIVRTEGHRIQQQATFDAQKGAKERGADIVKQWDSTMDKKTRPNHVKLDGQIREIDEPFEVNGKQAMYPAGFGVPHEDINCRCVMLQRARWALGEDEVTKMNNETKEIVKINEKNFESFKKVYNESVEEIVKETTFDIIGNTTKLKGAMGVGDYKEYTDLLNNHSNTDIKKLYSKYADGVDRITFVRNGGSYLPSENSIEFGYDSGLRYEEIHKYSTLAHEYGHYFDAKAKFKVNFKEIDSLNKAIESKGSWAKEWFKKKTSSSDEFLQAVRKDKEYIKNIFSNDLRKELSEHDGSSGVQDAIDGLFGERIRWGHGDKYYNRKYTLAKSLKIHNDIQKVYKELGLDASNLAKTKMIVRQYETASEMWANIMSAIVCGGKELEYVKKYLPNSYEALLKILEGVE